MYYGPLHEFGQGSPVWAPGYWVSAGQPVLLLHKRCGGPPVWEPSGQRVAFPIWERNWLGSILARIGILDTVAAELRVLAPRFRVLQLEQFDGQFVKGIDSPVFGPRAFTVDVTTARRKRTVSLLHL
ncbi:hypothetical protein CLV45_3528 [Hymenobacter chitinivorans DSM 11115]|uniref:Uncharacterized protein n=1 Tax=Hymenobacter chitinivorans DSM 11115 TaxID=1121954 RepID=A0A2M9B4K5_9BACT|nr:hypothetical protein CLV45_3528 [Hymenobacter chitinivorans DSM 11115]